MCHVRPPAPAPYDDTRGRGDCGVRESGNSKTAGGRSRSGEDEGRPVTPQANAAMILEDVVDGHRKIPYQKSRFSPRRHRPREKALGAHERLYELGKHRQRQVLLQWSERSYPRMGLRLTS